MADLILILNAGSSSLKFTIYRNEAEKPQPLADGQSVWRASTLDIAGAGVFGEQQGGDQIARQREEQRHADIPAAEQLPPTVKQQHQRHRHGTQPVDRGYVLQPRRRSLRRFHSCHHLPNGDFTAR